MITKRELVDAVYELEKRINKLENKLAKKKLVKKTKIYPDPERLK